MDEDAMVPGSPLPPACARFEPDLAEFALGLSTGRERAELVAHLETCDRCRAEVDQLTAAADALLEVVPPADPPVGFEVRLLEQLERGAAVSSLAARRRRRRVGEVVAAAAALVALAVGVGIGWAVSSPQPAPTASALGTWRGGHLVVVPLVATGEYAGHGAVGSLEAYTGSSDWLFMTLHDAAWHGEVRCVARLQDGSSLPLGSFWLTHGTGAWGVTVPSGHGAIRSAEVVTADGDVLASAVFPTS